MPTPKRWHEIEYIRKKSFRKEDRIRSILERRREQPGLAHIFLALEPCFSYKPWHNKQTGKTYLKLDSGKCLHYYFYFFHEQLGLCYLRVPTWCPFRLQFYFNGHAWLAAQLKQNGEKDHRFKGFNLLSEEDAALFRTLLRGEFAISGFTAKPLRQLLADKNSGQMTRLLRRLRAHGLIKKVGKRYKYYLTKFGWQAATMALKLRELTVIPQLAFDCPQAARFACFLCKDLTFKVLTLGSC